MAAEVMTNGAHTLNIELTVKKLFMTTKELNKAIHNLPTMQQFSDHNIDENFKREFQRLYGADNEFKYMDAKSIKIMFRLNLRHRIYALHTFGIHIEIPNDSQKLITA